MDVRSRRARQVQVEIGRVLWDHWDPIGINDVAEAGGEYDCCVGGVYRLLASGATASEVAAHLVAVEFDHMGLRPHRETPEQVARDVALRMPVAERLRALDVRLGA
jgi:hypothetical protein